MLMSDVKWIKITTDIFDDEKIVLIESMPEKYAIITCWFKLLCLAGKQNNNGVFLFNDKIAYTDEMIATIFRMDLNIVRLALNTFESFGMIEMINNVITIPNWNKHQSLDSYEKRKEYQRNLMRERRAKQKMLANCDANCNANVSYLDIEEDKDKEILSNDNIGTPVETKETFTSIINDYTDNLELRDCLKAFKEMRNKQKGFTTRALKLALNELNKLAINDDDKIAIVNQSVMNSWKGFYQIKDKKKQEKRLPNYQSEPQEYDGSEFDDLAERLKNRG